MIGWLAGIVLLLNHWSASGFSASTAGQEPSAEFEVAVVRENVGGETGGSVLPYPGGRFVVTNIPLSTLLGIAFFESPAYPDQVVGFPGWVVSARWDINARAPNPEATPQEMKTMLRTLLIREFRLETHVESRTVTAYAFERLHPDRLGTHLTVSRLDCEGPDRGTCRMEFRPGRIMGWGIAVENLARALGGPAGRRVVDRTGLLERIDVDIVWDAGGSDPDAVNAGSIFTAVQEQLGMRLVPTREPTTVLVVDAVRRPAQ